MKEGASVTVYVPSALPELGGLRVPVRTEANAVAYLKDAQWADAPTRPVPHRAGRDDHVEDRARRARSAPICAVAGRAPVRPAQRVRVDVAGSQVVATYDAALVRKEGAPLESRRFQAKVPVSSHHAASVAAGLSAANRAAGEVADWVSKLIAPEGGFDLGPPLYALQIAKG